MVKFTAVISKFAKQGEKTGWTYILIPAAVAEKLNPGNRKAFRVKGWIEEYQYKGISLMPMGGGDYIMALNAGIRKGIRKPQGAKVTVKMEPDQNPVQPPPEFLECLGDEPKALEAFNSLPKSHRNYFIKWIDTAKTDVTRAKRIAMAVNALARGMDFGQMLREAKGRS